MEEKRELISVEQAVAKLDEFCDNVPSLSVKKKAFTNALSVAKAMDDIRTALRAPGIINYIVKLQGSQLGFKTDRDRPKDGQPQTPYTPEELIDPIVVAVFFGLRPVNNEFNIISKNFYAAKNGFTRLLQELPGLSYKDVYGIPEMTGEREASIHVFLGWVYNGKKGSQELDFSIRVNAGMGADAITGKAERKSRKWLYENLTKSKIPDGDVDDAPLEIGPSAGSESKPETETPVEKKPEPEKPTKENTNSPGMVFVSVAQALAMKIGQTFNIRGYLVDMNTRTVKGDRKITTYEITDPESSKRIGIQYWDSPKPGAIPDGETKLTFTDVSIGQYNGVNQFTAKEIKVGW